MRSNKIARFDKVKFRTPVLNLLLLVVFFGVSPTSVQASSSTLALSEDEKLWLADHPTIRLAVDIDWSPFEYIDDDNNYVGMASEYISLVGDKLGIDFQVEKEKPWSEVVESVKSGELDMYSCVVSTEQRREYVNFSAPYLSFPMVIVTSDQVAYVNGLKDLRNETIAVVRGYATQDLLEKNHPELELYLADNVADALEKLSLGKVYAYIGNIATVSDVIRREGLTNIKISGQTPYSYELSMGVRKDWEEFMPILQKALDSITDALANGDSVVMRKFGAFQVKETKAKIGRNPKNPGRDVVIPPRARVKFKPGKEMKEKVAQVLPTLREQGAA